MFNYKNLSESEKLAISNALCFSEDSLIGELLEAETKTELLENIANFSMAMQADFIMWEAYRAGVNPKGYAYLNQQEPILAIDRFCVENLLEPVNKDFYWDQSYDALYRDEARRMARKNMGIESEQDKNII